MKEEQKIDKIIANVIASFTIEHLQVPSQLIEDAKEKMAKTKTLQKKKGNITKHGC